jgi:hypothetical protein
MKSHTVWWPHLDRAPIFNPFIPTTEHRLTSDRIEFSEVEEPDDAETPAQAPVESKDQDER